MFCSFTISPTLQGIGVSKLFNFFLAPSELTDRHGVNLLRLLEKSARVPEETADADGSVSALQQPLCHR